jgi:GNAT superfamily N-acetyltransferase
MPRVRHVIGVKMKYEVNGAVTNEELNGLFSACWPRRQTEPDTSHWRPVLEHSLAYVIARDNGALVGFVNVAWDGRVHAFLLDPRVHPDYRHQGIGVELVRLAAEAARAAGCDWLHVDFEPELAPFYEACGFRPTPAGLMRL